MKGIYLLRIAIKKKTRIKVGRLGEIEFEPGEYIYVGSAQRNLKRRIERHKRKKKKKFWHIDYLLLNKNVELVGVYIKENAKKEEECKTAKKLLAFGKGIKGFGASDSPCSSHLIKIENYKEVPLVYFKKAETKFQ